MALYDEWCLLSIGHADDRASDVIYQEGNSYLQKVVQSKVSHDNLSTQKRVQNLRSRIEVIKRIELVSRQFRVLITDSCFRIQTWGSLLTI